MKISHTAIGLAVASCLFARVAAAQSVTTHPEVSLGYQMLHIPDETYPLGLNLDVSGTMPNGWGLVGELGWAKDDQDEPGIDGALNFVHYGGGVRWGLSGFNARPFAQILAGGVHTSADTTLNQSSANAFMLQPGVGVVVPIGSQWGALGQFDYRRAFFDGADDNEWRFVLGVRFGVQ